MSGAIGDEIHAPDKYVRETLGSVGCDDDSFCSIVLDVRIVDSGERIVRMAERTPEDERNGEHAWLMDMPIGHPVHVRIDWEQNCTSEPGFWMGQGEALRLANLLIEAASWTPVAHRHPLAEPCTTPRTTDTTDGE